MISLAQVLLSLPVGADAPAVDFRTEVLPILKARCVECHVDPASNGGKRPKGGLRLDGKHWILAGTRSGPVIVPGDPAQSILYELVSLDADDLDRMPPESAPLTIAEQMTLRAWIAEGAGFGDWVGAPGPGVEVKPIPKPPTGKLPRIIGLFIALGEGVEPAAQEQVKRAAGERATILPVFPGSPLLAVGFPSQQGRTGTRDILSLAAVAETVAVLDLGRTRITNDALETVAKMSRLVKLDLRQTNVSDVGIRHLAGLSNLQSLNLFSAPVTDQAIGTIAGLAKLETVYLWQSKVTPAGIARLRALRPDLRVVDQANLPAPERGGQQSDEARGNRRRR